ncbi:integrase [Clostridia bacterium]|nr:integrase [Clostridia bacterium]GHV32823.1 integrase [Clostridia bacterium]
MADLEKWIAEYLNCCNNQKKLNAKTVKAYAIDLRQFLEHTRGGTEMRKSILTYLNELHRRFNPRTAKRKTASLKAFFHYLEFEELIESNPFDKIRTKFQEPKSLPKTIPLDSIERIFGAVYNNASLLDAAILELLFATGMRVSEVCAVKCRDIDLSAGVVRIMGKGSKERLMQISNKEALAALKRYKDEFSDKLNEFFFINRLGNRLSEQSVRFMLNKYAALAEIPCRITPHMFRHSFATLLLENDVDIRYIQRMLGHSSIVTTQIYTHVASEKQRTILSAKHPRNTFSVDFQKHA